MNAEITRNIDDADIVIAHKNFVKGGAKVLSTAEKDRLQIFYVKTNSMAQIQKVIKQALDITELNEKQTFYDVTEKALDETKAAIDQILAGTKRDIELKPQSQQIRKLQRRTCTAKIILTQLP